MLLVRSPAAKNDALYIRYLCWLAGWRRWPGPLGWGGATAGRAAARGERPEGAKLAPVGLATGGDPRRRPWSKGERCLAAVSPARLGPRGSAVGAGRGRVDFFNPRSSPPLGGWDYSPPPGGLCMLLVRSPAPQNDALFILYMCMLLGRLAALAGLLGLGWGHSGWGSCQVEA